MIYHVIYIYIISIYILCFTRKEYMWEHKCKGYDMIITQWKSHTEIRHQVLTEFRFANLGRFVPLIQ